MVFKSPVIGKWQPLGEDGNEFDRSTEGRAEAWREAQAAANLGMPWAGATFRLVDPFEGDHRDDCVLGLDSTAWCDCGVELAVVEERVVMPEFLRSMNAVSAYPEGLEGAPLDTGRIERVERGSLPAVEKLRTSSAYGQFSVKTRRVDMPELGPLVVEATVEAVVQRNDRRTLQELSRLSEDKLAELWTGRDAQNQVLSNVLHGRSVPREKRHLIKERMKGRPLFELATVVAEVLS
jgi:hypothetical protein